MSFFSFLLLAKIGIYGDLYLSLSFFLSPGTNSWLRSQEEAAASRLQRWWRLWHARRLRRALVARRAAAATAIAAAWRGYATRRRLSLFGCDAQPSGPGTALASRVGSGLGSNAGSAGFNLASIRARVRAALTAKRAAAVVIQVLKWVG